MRGRPVPVADYEMPSGDHIMDAVILLSVLSTINPADAFERIARGDLPGSLVVTAFLLLVIAGWSVQGGLAHRRNG